MDRNQKVARGDILIRFGKILKVVSIDNEIVKMKPFFENDSNNGLIYSIPCHNFENNRFRKLMNKAILKQIWEKIMVKDFVPMEINVVDSRNDLAQNSLADSLRLIKSLWLEKQTHAGFLPGGKLSLYQQALTQAADEVAAVKGLGPNEAKVIILSALKKPVL